MVVMRPGGRGTSPALTSWAVSERADVPTRGTDGTYVYVVTDRGIMWCLDAKTGKEIYGKQRLKRAIQRIVHMWPMGRLHHERGRADHRAAHGAEVRDSRGEQLRHRSLSRPPFQKGRFYSTTVRSGRLASANKSWTQ